MDEKERSAMNTCPGGPLAQSRQQGLEKSRSLTPGVLPPDCPGPVSLGISPQRAANFLQGSVPGLMANYAPDSRTDPNEGWVESDETVERLREWRETAIY